MSLTPEEVENIAHLARLQIDKADVPEYTKNLSNILGLVAQLNQIDTTDVEPAAHPFEINQRMRNDEVTETDQREAFQTIAPQVEAGLYLVPRVIEEG